MDRYRQHLQYKYELLKLTSPDEMLDCCSSQYISLTLEVDEQTKKLSSVNKNEKGDEVTLPEALDVTNKKERVILFEGGPGMGKSTLAINICKRWAKGDLLQDYDAVILLPLRDPEIQDAKNIGDLLLIDGEMKEKVLNEITNNNGERTCFIFEGYDELPHPLRKKPIFTKLTERLPKCTLIYTSRPEASIDVRSISSRVIKIMGFTKESVDEYVTQTFDMIKDGGAEVASRLKSQLHSNQHIKSVLHIPIIVAIVCLVFFHFSVLPDTMTQLYTLFCLRLILRHITTRTSNAAQIAKLNSLDNLPEGVSKQFDDLCLIAYHGMVNKKIIFSTNFLCDIGIAVEQLKGFGLLLIAPTTSVYGREKTYNFLHLTLQEFCAARYMSKCLSPEQQQSFLKFEHSHNITDYPQGMLYMFYSGITGLKDQRNVESIVPYEQRLIGLNVLHLINCAYEAHNNAACQMIGNVLNGAVDLTGCMSSAMLSKLDYFLMQSKGPLNVLKVSVSYVDDEIFMELLSLLVKRQSQHIDRNFSLESKDCMITYKSYFLLTELLQSSLHIVELNIGKTHGLFNMQIRYRIRLSSKLKYSLQCGKVLTDVDALPNAFTSSRTLTVLDVSGLHIGPEGAAYLAGCRGVVLRNLRMSGCKLGPTGADKIGEMVCYNKSIASVNLAYNKIGDNGVAKLVCHLEKCPNSVHTLNLEGNNISVAGACWLRKLIKTKNSSLTSIELSHNPLKDKGVCHILQAFTILMEHIGLINVEMKSSSIPYVANALCKVKSIGFTIPCFADYEVIIDSLAKTNVLQCLELHLWGGFKPKYKTINTYLKHLKTTCYQFHPYLYSLWQQTQSQNILWYGKFSTSCDGSSGGSVSPLRLNIEHFKSVILPKDLPLVEESHTFFTTPKKKKVASSIDKAFVLLLLLQLKR